MSEVVPFLQGSIPVPDGCISGRDCSNFVRDVDRSVRGYEENAVQYDHDYRTLDTYRAVQAGMREELIGDSASAATERAAAVVAHVAENAPVPIADRCANCVATCALSMLFNSGRPHRPL